MFVFENILDGIGFAKEKITDVAHNVVEKNKKNAQLNRLRRVMKQENETIAKAYQALGKIFYENMTDEQREENALLCQIVEKSSSRMEKAYRRYVQVMNDREDEEVSEVMSDEDIEDITVACSNESKYEKTEEDQDNADVQEKKEETPTDETQEKPKEEISEVAEGDLF